MVKTLPYARRRTSRDFTMGPWCYPTCSWWLRARAATTLPEFVALANGEGPRAAVNTARRDRVGAGHLSGEFLKQRRGGHRHSRTCTKRARGRRLDGHLRGRSPCIVGSLTGSRYIDAGWLIAIATTGSTRTSLNAQGRPSPNRAIRIRGGQLVRIPSPPGKTREGNRPRLLEPRAREGPERPVRGRGELAKAWL